MFSLLKLALVAASLVTPLASASAASSELAERQAAASWWYPSVAGHGAVPGNANYQVFRNVMDFGAKGDGVTDDSAAINSAISSGGRCGQGCNSSTTTPAVVFFPSGTYLVKETIIQYYFTQLVGDAVNPPTIKADPSLKAMAVIDSDPYDNSGNNWWVNQNNFYRQVRNFVLDLTSANPDIAAIHWQVAQATSLTNIQFKMAIGSNQKGIFMDNGSGGFMSDLTFDGGSIGAFFGNQQFTTRNLKFTNCQTAIFMNWNWVWNLKSINVDSSCGTGVNMTAGAPSQSVGSVVIQDSVISSKVGVATAYNPASKASNGTLIIDNVDFTKSAQAVQNVGDATGNLAGGSVVASWAQGSSYTTATSDVTSALTQNFALGSLEAPTRPASLVSNGIYAEATKPQYTATPASNVISVKAKGAKGDGVTDDTAALQAIFDAATPDQVIFFDHGNYLLKSTLTINNALNIVGEVWPVIMADGPSFSDASNPKVVFQVGSAGSAFDVQITDLVFSTSGAAPGAILMEWNTKGSGTPGASGLWDTHWRIGGWTGSGLQTSNCARAAAGQPQPMNQDCFGAFLLFHMTEGSSAYIENVWWWVADHDMDDGQQTQLNIYNGRGVLVETQGPTWFYGTASEHSQLYNFAFNGAANAYMGVAQTETAYMQGGANGVPADKAFTPNTKYADPDFSSCQASDTTCNMTWGLRVTNSQDILVYGAGFYSFFDDYEQKCLISGGGSDNCQLNMVFVDDCSSDVYLYALSTKASVNMLTLEDTEAIVGAVNPSTFTETVAVVEIA